MNVAELESISDYKAWLTEKLTGWSQQQHLSLAACLADRWLPAYESFSAEENWGDPTLLHSCLDSAWDHVSGRTLNAPDVLQWIRQIEDVTPHMDEFDALEALMACWVVTETLQACGDPQNTAALVSSMPLQILENMLEEEWPVGGAAEERVWKSLPVRNEVQAQLQLIDSVEEVTDFSEQALQELRSRIRSLRLDEVPQPSPPAASGITNQAAFEAYRRSIESDLKQGRTDEFDPGDDPHLLGMHWFGIWAGRYSRRLQTINGEFGRMMDEPGCKALIAKNRAHDAADGELPAWPDQTLEMIEMCLANNSQSHVVDVGSVGSPHGYGPSLRRLWLEGIRRGQSDNDGWNHVSDWANHRPAAWDFEDERKQMELGELLARQLTWKCTDDADHPWTTDVDGQRWQVCINDFPDELMYGLKIAGECVGKFHDWPEAWNR